MCQDEAIGRVGGRGVETPSHPAHRIFKIVDVGAPLDFEMDMLVAGKGALSGRAEAADALASTYDVAGFDDDLREVAVHGTVALRFVDDADDEPARIAGVARHHDATVGGGEHLGAEATGEIDTAMRGRQWIALTPEPATEGRQDVRRTGGRSRQHTDEARERQHGEEDDGEERDEQATEIRAT